MKQSDPNHQFIALAAHLFLACFAAGGAALFVAAQLGGIPQPTRWAIALSAAGLIGLLLTWSLQRTLYFIDLTLWRLVHSLPIEFWPRKNASALEGTVAKLRVLTRQERPYHQYRSQQLQQAEEAAAQAVRNRLARDLHDSIKQQLFSIQISTAAAQARWETDLKGAQKALADVRHSTQAAMVEMDALLHQLAPNPLEKVGLVHALREQCEALAYRTDADVQVQIGALPDEDRFPPGTETAVFRVAQESLSNIARHARAQHITLRLQQTKDQSALVLTLTDDGRGFKQSEATQGMGLSNMHERTSALRGELTITSQLDEGTTIEALFPLQETTIVKEQQMTQPDNRLNRFSLTALLGGFAAIIVLLYPVQLLLPSRYLDSWPQGTAVLGWASVLLALFIYAGSGYMAVRQVQATTWKQRLGWGASAGGIAGSISYFGLIAAGMSIVGAQHILQHGVGPTASEVEFMWLLINDTVGVVWWTTLTFWAVAGLSVLLGAIGGLLRPTIFVKDEQEEITKSLLATPLFVASLTSLFTLILTTALYFLLGEQTVQAAVESLDYTPGSFRLLWLFGMGSAAAAPWPVLFPPSMASVLPILTTLIVYLLVVGGLWLVLRDSATDNRWQQRRQTIVIAYLTAFFGGLAILMLSMITVNQTVYLWVGNVAILILSVLCARTAVQLEPHFQGENTLPSSLEQWVFALPVPTLILVYFTAAMNWFGLGALLLVVTAVSILFIPTRQMKHEFRTTRLPQVISIAMPSILALAMPLLLLYPSALGLLFLVVRFIPFLSHYPRNDVEPLVADFTVMEPVQTLFQVQISSLLLTLFTAVMLVGIALVMAKIMDNRR